MKFSNNLHMQKVAVILMDRSNKASEPGADPDNAPIWNFNDDKLKFNTNNVDNANENYGSASGFRVPVPSVCN